MKHPRLRSLLVGGVSLAAVAAIGTVWATTSVAADARYVTAVAATGDVSQSYVTTGDVSRRGVVDAAFSVSGTVKKVKVAVGDEVAAGDVLATLDTTALKLALLNAETDLASAKATLYAARHPSSSSAGSGGSGKAPSGESGSGGSGSSSGSSGSDVTGGITASDAAQLYEAIAAVNVATLKWSNPNEPTTCDAIYAALLNANEQTADDDANSGSDSSDGDTDSGGDSADPANPGTGDTGGSDSGGSDSGGSDSGNPDSGATETGDTGSGSGSDNPASGDTDTGSSDSGDNSADDGGGSDTGSSDTGSGDTDSGDTGSTTDEPSEDATTLSLVVDDITLDDIKACGEAREALVLANAVLADYYQQLIATGTIVTDDEQAEPTPGDTSAPASGSTSSSAKKSSSSSSSTSVSARAVASAKADVLKAEQAVSDAETALENAELVAPVAGTVGSVGLSAGGSASAGTVTIVGEGTAIVSIEVPLATRTLLSQGMPATVTPAGSMDSLDGTIGTINILETDGTAGDSPTYTTTVVVEDPDMMLKEGARAAVEVVTGTASGVVTVPTSAVTPTGTGTGTVQIVDSTSASSAETVTVSTGAVGGGRVEITSGLAEGQIVVLSDPTLALPTGNTGQTQRVISGGGGIPR